MSNENSGGFMCPECGSIQTCVIDSRGVPSVGQKRRRRKCSKCEARWTTLEITYEEYLALKENSQIQALRADLSGVLARYATPRAPRPANTETARGVDEHTLHEAGVCAHE